MKGCLKCQGRMYQLGKLEPIIRGRKINEENEIKKKKKKNLQRNSFLINEEKEEKEIVNLINKLQSMCLICSLDLM